MEHDTDLQTSEEATTLVLDHFMLGSCTPFAYEDYFIHINPDQEEDNLVLEVEALTDSVAPRLLEVYLFDALIPTDRNSEQRSQTAQDNVYSIAINSHDLHAGDFILSVHCQSEPVQFRVIGRLVHAELHVGEMTSGAVCPGEWVYHTYVYESDTDSHDEVLQFELNVHSGDFYFLVRPDHPPIKLSPPYQRAESDYSHGAGHHESTRALVCAVSSGTEYYLALRGAQHCSEYDVTVSLVAPENVVEAQEECRAQEKQYVQVHATTVRNLVRDGFVYSTVEPHEIHDFVIDVAPEEARRNNIVFEVEAINDIYNPSALRVSLYERVESIPEDRVANRVAEFAHGTTYDISLNYLELKAGRYFLSVRSMGEPVRYRTAVRLIQASLFEEKPQFGQVCPGRWTFHYADVPAGHDGVDFEAHMFSGQVYMAFAREKLTPGFNSINGYELVVGNRTAFHSKTCLPEREAERVYFAMFGGGDVCADYSLNVHYLDGDRSCETAGEDGYSHTSQYNFYEGRSVVQTSATRAILFLKNSTGYVLAMAMILFLTLRLWLGRKQFGSSLTGLIKVRSRPGGNDKEHAKNPEEVDDEDAETGFDENPLAEEHDSDHSDSEADDEHDRSTGSHDNPAFAGSATEEPAERKKGKSRRLHFNKSHKSKKVIEDSRESEWGSVADVDMPPEDGTASPSFDVEEGGAARESQRENGAAGGRLKRGMSGRFGGLVGESGGPDVPQGDDTNAYNAARRGSLYELFQEIDVDASGSLDVDEVAILARRLGRVLDTEGSMAALHEMNPDGDEVSFDQFSVWWKEINQGDKLSSIYKKGQGLSVLIKAPTLINATINEKKRRKVRKQMEKECKDGIAVFGRMFRKELDKDTASQMVIYREEAVEHLRTRIRAKRDTIAGLFYISAFMLFFGVLIDQKSVRDSFELEHAMSEYFKDKEGTCVHGKCTFNDLQSMEDIFDWMETGLLETVFPQEVWYNGDEYTEKEKYYLLGYNKLVGGFRITQSRVDPNAGDCYPTERFHEFYPTCWPAYSDAAASNTPFGPPHDPEKYVYDVDDVGNGGYFVRFRLDRQLAYLKLAELRADRWLDKFTRHIVLDFSIYNDNKNMFGSVRVEFDVLNTGLIDPHFHMMSLKVEHYHTAQDMGRYTGEVMLMAYLAINVAMEVHEFKTLGFVVHFSSGWNYVDFCRMAYSFIATLLWLRIIFHDSATSLKLPLEEGVNYIDFDELISLHNAYSDVTALLVVMCLLSVMKYLRHSRRYGIMIMTIEGAAADLFQFQVTFSLVMVTFAVMGMQMFGHILEEFSAFGLAYQTLMTMTTGEYGYENVQAYPGGYMFYFLYLGLVYFLLVQMFMAIILDNYAVVMAAVREQDANQRYKYQYTMAEEVSAAFWRALPFTYNPEDMFFLTSEEMLSLLTDPDTLGNDDNIGIKKTPEPTVENPYPGTKTVISMNDLNDLPWVTMHCKWLLLQIGVLREVEKNVVLVHMLNAKELKQVDHHRHIDLRSKKMVDDASCDPFVLIQVGENSFQTSVQKQTTTPIWDKYFEFTGLDMEEIHHRTMTVSVFDKEAKGKRPMGVVTIHLNDMDGEYKWYDIEPCEGMPEPEGKIRMSCAFYPLFPEKAKRGKAVATSSLFGGTTGGGNNDEAVEMMSQQVEGLQADNLSLKNKVDHIEEQLSTVISLLQDRPKPGREPKKQTTSA
jgi:hypothetical protein